jgi:hypothetical protein
MGDDDTTTTPISAAAAVRARATGVQADGRLPKRRRADNVWEGARRAVAEKYGERTADLLLPIPAGATTPIAAPWDHPDGLGSQLLDAALERERILLNAEAAGVSDSALETLERDFHASTLAWINRAVATLAPKEVSR